MLRRFFIISGMLTKAYSFLFLGDSYTVGEGLPLQDSYPYQLVQLLREDGMDVFAPEITAKTGWTTDELLSAMGKYSYRQQYDFTMLLIGVNNQYRGRSAIEYASQFELLLNAAKGLAGDKSGRTIVLSIPDWGVTPFAGGKDRAAIGREIDHYNHINRQLALEAGVHYIDITPGSREAATDPALLAADQLHPSANAYREWALAVKDIIYQQLNQHA